MQVLEPNPERVEEAIVRFEYENSHEERALRGLFSFLPRNDDPAHVLLKVCAVNSIYSTHVFAVRELANHICDIAVDLDQLIADGDPHAFDLLERFELKNEHREHVFHLYSFASKYLSWHKPEKYPIYDRYAWAYIRALSKQSNMPSRDDQLWPYANYLVAIRQIAEKFGVSQFSYKQLDAFFFFEGEKLFPKKDAP